MSTPARHVWFETSDFPEPATIDMTCDVCGVNKIREAYTRVWDIHYPDGSMEQLERVPECEGAG